jgi:hypothetical protein
MKLFRVSLKSVNKWDTKIRNLYVIWPEKKGAIDFVNRNKQVDFEISKVCYLGHELSSCMFKGGKKE